MKATIPSIRRTFTAVAVISAIFLVSLVAGINPCIAQDEGVPGRPAVATQTLSNTDEFTDTSVVPDDVVTQEDFARDVFGEREEGAYSVSIWRVLGSLAIVILLIVGVVYLMRLLLARGMRYDLKGRHIRVLDVVQLGMNRSLYLVAVGKKLVLLGSSDKGLNYIMEITGGGSGDIREILGAYAEEGGVEFQQDLESAVETASRESGLPATGTSDFVEKVKDKLRRLEDDRRRER